MIDSPEKELARTYIEEYLRSRGHTLQSICKLPEGEARQLWIDVSLYVSNRLAEMSAKSRLVHEIEGSTIQM